MRRILREPAGTKRAGQFAPSRHSDPDAEICGSPPIVDAPTPVRERRAIVDMTQSMGWGFQHPEFYANDIPVCTVYGPYGAIEIRSEGESLMDFQGETFETPADFLRRFPDGDIPSAAPFEPASRDVPDWHKSKRFEFYRADNGRHLDIPHWTLDEAIAEARRLVEWDPEQAARIDLADAVYDSRSY
jgi:hypothetical protein